MTFDEFLEQLREYEEQPKIWVVDPVRQTEFMQAYKGIKALVLTEESDATIECKMHEANIGAGVIEIEAEWFVVREIQSFCAAISKANNFEIYPLTNNTVRMSIMFYNIYKRIA